MKKSEFLEAVKGCKVVFGWKPAFDLREKGQRTVEGLPESVKGVHVNQAFAWLSEEFAPQKLPHPNLKIEEARLFRHMDYEDETGFPNPDTDETAQWVDWFYYHPYTAFQC